MQFHLNRSERGKEQAKCFLTTPGRTRTCDRRIRNPPRVITLTYVDIREWPFLREIWQCLHPPTFPSIRGWPPHWLQIGYKMGYTLRPSALVVRASDIAPRTSK